MDSYRQFLRRAIEDRFKYEGRVNYAAFSRRAGFRSRSYIFELLQGKKRVTSRSLPRIIYGLNLKGNEKALFESLVWQEERDLRPFHLKPEKIQERIDLLRAKLSQEAGKSEGPEAAHLFLNRHVFSIYAAIGPASTGTLFAEVCRRTGISPDQVEGTLQYLLKSGAIYKVKNRFFAGETHVDFGALGDNVGFQEIFKESLADLANLASTARNSPNTLILHSAFAVAKARLPELKSRLEGLMSDFIVENHEDGADSIAKLTVGLYR